MWDQPNDTKKQQIGEWIAIFMKLKSFRLSCKLQSFSPPNSSRGVGFPHGSRVLGVRWLKI